jgi:hypothetical protein
MLGSLVGTMLAVVLGSLLATIEEANPTALGKLLGAGLAIVCWVDPAILLSSIAMIVVGTIVGWQPSCTTACEGASFLANRA